MSNFLAIATVTATLSQMLQTGIATDLPGATVTMVRPAGTGNATPATGINLYLYQVTHNGAWRNADLPTRTTNGQLTQRPRVALDLHYLLTFYGSEGQLEPQRLLGSAVRTLHERPVLTRQIIRDTITNPSFAFLGRSNLADDIELVKFTPLPLSLEELSKLWSVFFQTQYTLSVAYQGTVVLIESEKTPHEALPVRERKVYVLPFERPTIESVSPQIILPGGTLTIQGHNLQGEVTRVRFAAGLFDPATLNENEITIALPAGLSAGVNTVLVIHDLDFGTAVEPHRGFQSNAGVFLLAPRLTPPIPASAARGTTLMLNFTPPVTSAQRVTLLVGDLSIGLPARPPGSPPVTTLGFPIPADFPTGNFFVRLQVDGAESQLDIDVNNHYTGPKVTIT